MKQIKCNQHGIFTKEIIRSIWKRVMAITGILYGLVFIFIILLSSCSEEQDDIIGSVPERGRPYLSSFTFCSKDNPLQLIEDVQGEIIGDSVVECWIPNITSSKQLIAQIEFQGTSVFVDDLPYNKVMVDFKKPVKLTIYEGNKTKDYTIYVHAFTGLPILWIDTNGRQDIKNKTMYIRGKAKLVEDVHTRAAGDYIEDSIFIKGRGHSSWDMPKKPYRLKFDNKVSLCDSPKDRSWVLLNNYADKTMLRVQTAFYMGHISILDYTPQAHFVELMLNGRYNGTYLLCEKLKIAKHRVNVGEDGFLLEIDGRAAKESDSKYFIVEHLPNPVCIKDPDVEYDDDNYNYAKIIVTTADSVLYSDNFKNPTNGWRKYYDIESFVDWYLINEITHNTDSRMNFSCFMNVERNGKLKMGPLWDFDIAFGNTDYANRGPEGFWLKSAKWFSRMFDDPAFVLKVKERFNYFYNNKDDILHEINVNAQYLKYSAQENENKWHTFYNYTWPNYDIWGNYYNEVQCMKEWLDARFEWLKTKFDEM